MGTIKYLGIFKDFFLFSHEKKKKHTKKHVVCTH